MTPLSSDGSSDEECVATVETQHDLTVTSNMRYNLSIRTGVCGGDVMGNESEPETLLDLSLSLINYTLSDVIMMACVVLQMKEIPIE